MSSLDEMAQEGLCKVLLIGDSGTGKTGALISLIKAGYNVRILHFDPQGIAVLVHNLSKEERGRVRVVQLADEMRNVRGVPVPRTIPTACAKAANMLDRWIEKDAGIDYGGVNDWGPEDVLVLDSATYHGKMCLNHAMGLTGWTAPRRASAQEWGHAQVLQSHVLTTLNVYARCHVVVTSHVRLIGGDEDDRIEIFDKKQDIQEQVEHKEESREAREALVPLRGYPSTIGRQLPMQTGTFFDYVFKTYVKPQPGRPERRMTSEADGFIEAKCPIPSVPIDMPVSEGLATLFKAVKDAVQ